MSANVQANLVFVNGDVLHSRRGAFLGRALVVRDGVIVAVGAGDAIADLQRDATEVFDLRGRMLLPGFQTRMCTPSAAISRCSSVLMSGSRCRPRSRRSRWVRCRSRHHAFTYVDGDQVFATTDA